MSTIPPSSSLPRRHSIAYSTASSVEGYGYGITCLPKKLNINMKPAGISEKEYEALPISIQRKYFSSLERLRINEKSNTSFPCRLPLGRSGLASDPGTTTLPKNRQVRSLSRHRNRLRKLGPHRLGHNISQAEAQWFLSLPEKVRRRHFSREEQVLLAGRCETILHVPTVEVPIKLELPVRRDSHDTLSPSASVSERGRSRRRYSDSIVESVVEDTEDVEQSLPVQNIEDEFEDEDMESMPEALPARRSRRSSFRRTLSLTTNPFSRQSTSSAPTPASPGIAHGQANWRARAASYTGAGVVIREPAPPMPIIDPHATYYQDPEARMKLRLYLASPQKFDEAIEFGFPSTAGSDKHTSFDTNRPIPDSRKTSHDLQTFLRDDRISFLDESDDEEDEDEEDIKPGGEDVDIVDVGQLSDDDSVAADSPVTPHDPEEAFRHQSRFPASNMSSLDSNGLPPIQARPKPTDPFEQALSGNREMTLRMTLTRPDLRADEQLLYGWQSRGKDDPLALEELPPVTEDETGGQGAFAIHSHRQVGLVKKFLSKVKINKH